MKQENIPCNCSQEQELDRYAKSVRDKIRNQAGGLFQNNSPLHASIIIREFLDAAEKTVCLFCGKLSESVYGALQVFFSSAIERNVRVRVITESSYEETGAKNLAEYLKSKDSLRCLAWKKEDSLPHFLLVDGRMYRLEVKQEQKEALVCAAADKESGTKETARVMAQAFEKLWKENSAAVEA